VKKKSCVDCKQQTEEGVRLPDGKKRRSESPGESVCRTVCVATNQSAEREGVGHLEEKEFSVVWSFAAVVFCIC